VSRVTLARASNPGPMTLDGTNSWVLVEPGHRAGIVIDPGPADPQHLQALLVAARNAGASDIGLVLLTHGHPDHGESAPEFAAMTGAPVRAFDPALCIDAPPLLGDESIELDGLRLDVVATPGHTGDSMCLVLLADRSVFTGDTLLGRGSTVVAHPDGRLADYLDSLRNLRSRVEAGELCVVRPGHGPTRDDVAGLIDGYLAHREQRLGQVRQAIAGGAHSVDAVLQAVYADVDPALQHAARWSLLAQLDYLRESGEPAPDA
jgi:glyoxylase-like metal-dependent hydrolase (beta-lactamase superfamily II)